MTEKGHFDAAIFTLTCQALQRLPFRQPDSELVQRDEQGEYCLQPGSPRPQTVGAEEFDVSQ